jgi:MFS-type transporter involved in bile tolerance (Atg22 family)
MTEPLKDIRRQQRAWAMYSWANHSYVTAVLVTLFPLFLSST